jgi:hypothetical protein
VDTISQIKEEIKKENPKGATQNMKVGKNKKGLSKWITLARVNKQKCNEHKNNQVCNISYIKTGTCVNLVRNLNHETRKTKTKIQHMQNKNPTRFYYKNKIRTNQGCDKKRYPKLVFKAT